MAAKIAATDGVELEALPAPPPKPEGMNALGNYMSTMCHMFNGTAPRPSRDGDARG